MPRITNIQARKGTATDWSTQNPVLASGEFGYDLTNKILKIGDGSSSWNSLGTINLSSSSITDFNTAVSGLLPVKAIIAGTNITISNVSGSYTINSSGGSISSYSTTIGNGSSTSFTITHNLNVTNDSYITVRDTSTNYYVYPDIKYVNSNSVLIEFVSAPTSNQYRVSIIGF